MNMCSKCFADIQKKQPDVSCSTKSSPMSGCSQSSVYSSEASSSSSTSQTSSALTTCPEQPPAKDTDLTSASAQEGASCTEAARGTLCISAKRRHDSEEESVRKRARLCDRALAEEPTVAHKQKEQRRCHRCRSKLELVQQELGSCRCGNVFCMLHRLPEQHECAFDHQGHGRQQAGLKMVKLERKLGRSCQRIGEECS